MLLMHSSGLFHEQFNVEMSEWPRAFHLPVIQCTSNRQHPCLTLTDLHNWYERTRLAPHLRYSRSQSPRGRGRDYFLLPPLRLLSWDWHQFILIWPHPEVAVWEPRRREREQMRVRVCEFSEKARRGEDEGRRRGLSKSVCEEVGDWSGVQSGFLAVSEERSVWPLTKKIKNGNQMRTDRGGWEWG